MRKNENGITLIALIVTIVVLIIIAGIGVATLTADNGVLRQINTAKVEQLEANAREQMDLACSAVRLAIAEASARDNSYKANENASLIQNVLKDMLEKDSQGLESTGWKLGTIDDDEGKFVITYEGDDYKNACNDDNAVITYTITLSQKLIEVTDVGTGIKGPDGSDASIDVGGNTENGTGSGTGDGTGDGTGSNPEVASAAGLYETGTSTMKYSWQELIDNGIINENGSVVDGKESELAGDLIISDTITYIPYAAFNYCSALTGVKIPNSVTSIGGEAFYECTSLANVVMTERVNDYGYGTYVFYGCSSLKSLKIPEGVTKLEDGHLGGMDNLEELYLPNTLNNVDEKSYIAFAGDSVVLNEYDNGYYLGSEENPYLFLVDVTDTNITTCNIHPDTKIINSYVFSSCDNITSLTVPANVVCIRYRGLAAPRLETLTMLGSVPPEKVDGFDGESIAVIVPKGSLEAYTSTYPWSSFAEKIIEAE